MFQLWLESVQQQPWSTTLLLSIVLSCAVTAVIYRYTRLTSKYSHLPLPPGPSGLPLVGNALQLGAHPYLTLHQWQQRYGDVVHVKIFNRHWIILSSDKAVQDLLSKRGAHYSDRPYLYLAGDILYRGSAVLPFRPADDTWRMLRRLANAALRPSNLHLYADDLLYETRQVARAMLDASSAAGSAGISATPFLQQLALSNIFNIVYGRQTHSTYDALYTQHHITIERLFSLIGTRSMLIDYFPLLRFVKRQHYRDVLQVRTEIEEVRRVLMEEERELMASGQPSNCFARQLLEQQAEEDISDTQMAGLCGSLVTAGYETSALTLRWVFLLLITYPKVQQRLHAELDAVVGRDRTPNELDLPQLRYVDATVKECLRLRNPALLGVPHCTNREDTYRGYRIPANATVVVNTWSLHQDNSVYADADQFNPERFLAGDGQPEAVHWAFGAGRRVCVGKHFAEYELKLALATFVWAFELLPALDTHGQPESVSLDYFTHGLTNTHLPYQVRIVPRSDAVHAMLGA